MDFADHCYEAAILKQRKPPGHMHEMTVFADDAEIAERAWRTADSGRKWLKKRWSEESKRLWPAALLNLLFFPFALVAVGFLTVPETGSPEGIERTVFIGVRGALSGWFVYIVVLVARASISTLRQPTPQSILQEVRRRTTVE